MAKRRAIERDEGMPLLIRAAIGVFCRDPDNPSWDEQKTVLDFLKYYASATKTETTNA